MDCCSFLIPLGTSLFQIIWSIFSVSSFLSSLLGDISQAYKQIQFIPILIKPSSDLHGHSSYCHFIFLSLTRNHFTIFIFKKNLKRTLTEKSCKYSTVDILFLSCWKKKLPILCPITLNIKVYISY